MSVSVHACACACVHAGVPPCLRSCVPACLRACARNLGSRPRGFRACSALRTSVSPSASAFACPG
eukprot:9014372-Alexandrium_andersonii.AAC.1